MTNTQKKQANEACMWNKPKRGFIEASQPKARKKAHYNITSNIMVVNCYEPGAYEERMV